MTRERVYHSIQFQSYSSTTYHMNFEHVYKHHGIFIMQNITELYVVGRGEKTN